MSTPKLPMTPEQWDEFMRSPDSMHSDIIELRRRDYAARIEVDQRELEVCKRGEFREWRDQARNRLLQEIRVSVFGKDHPDKHVIRFPSDWWQAVKERFAPAWFRDRWPVQFTTVIASLEETYPHLKPALPDRDPVWHIRVTRRPEFPTF